MTTITPKQFEVVQTPKSSCLYPLIIAGLFFGLGAPLIFLIEHFTGTLGFFAGGLLVAILLNLFADRWMHAQTTVALDNLGITFEITRKGLFMPEGATFYSWDQFRGFRYAKAGKGPYILTFHWIDGSSTKVQQKETEMLSLALQQDFQDREMHYWLWPDKE